MEKCTGHQKVSLSVGNWIAIGSIVATQAAAILTAWVALNSRVTRVEATMEAFVQTRHQITEQVRNGQGEIKGNLQHLQDRIDDLLRDRNGRKLD